MSCIDRIARLKSLQLYGMAAAWGSYKPRNRASPPHRKPGWIG